MNQATSYAQPTLLDTILPAASNSWLYKVVLVLAGSALLTVSAKMQVPFYPVPMTMQTFAVLVIGMAFGWKLGGLTVLAYLLEGAFGLPVFAGTPVKGIGLAYMAGPTGGYLVGFLMSAMTVGYLAERGFDRSVLTTLIAMVIGTALIFLCGYVWLSSLIGLEKAFQFGVLPFVWGGVFKIALAAAVLPMCWKLVKR
jgi:biotin transport system substrate-specific component